MSELPAYTVVPTLARKIVREVRLMLADGILSEAGLFEVATRAIYAGQRLEREERAATKLEKCRHEH